MKLYGRAETAAQQIISQFKSGNLPKVLAPVFIHRKDNVPCRSWSWSNQLLAVAAGYTDARGVRQWNQVSRTVKAGSKAVYILAPCYVKSKDKTDDNDKPRQILVGFRSIPVFGYEQTEGEPLPKDEIVENILQSLPLREVAESWGLNVTVFNGRYRTSQGWFAPGKGEIGVGVENLSTWAHELVHAADHRLGTLTERGQHWSSETVAELGGATLLCALELTTDADMGGAWEYISRYAHDASIQPIRACMQVLGRVCEAVDLILTTAENLQRTEKAA